jgi:hypothetical protein
VEIQYPHHQHRRLHAQAIDHVFQNPRRSQRVRSGTTSGEGLLGVLLSHDLEGYWAWSLDPRGSELTCCSEPQAASDHMFAALQCSCPVPANVG